MNEANSEIHPYLLSFDATDTPDITLNGVPYWYPATGSLWLNTRKNEIYRVEGVAAACENESEEFDQVLYIAPNWKGFRYRSIEEWFGKNRHGNWRFIQVPLFSF